MKCSHFSVASKRSPLMPPQREKPGTRRPCSFNAVRRCPNCSAILCNGHSRGGSSMRGDCEAPKRRRCAACGTVSHDFKWLAVS